MHGRLPKTKKAGVFCPSRLQNEKYRIIPCIFPKMCFFFATASAVTKEEDSKISTQHVIPIADLYLIRREGEQCFLKSRENLSKVSVTSQTNSFIKAFLCLKGHKFLMISTTTRTSVGSTHSQTCQSHFILHSVVRASRYMWRSCGDPDWSRCGKKIKRIRQRYRHR